MNTLSSELLVQTAPPADIIRAAEPGAAEAWEESVDGSQAPWNAAADETDGGTQPEPKELTEDDIPF